MEDQTDKPTQGMSIAGSSPVPEAQKLLRRCLPRLRKALGYMPGSVDFDQEDGSVRKLVREIDRFLG